MTPADVAEGGIMPPTARSLSAQAGTACASQRDGVSQRSLPSCSAAGRPSTRAARRRAATASTSLRSASAPRAGLLGQLLAVVGEDQRRVQVARRRQAQRALQVDLARGVVGQVLAAHDVGDALRRVVDDHRELVGPQAVGALEHEVADGAP